MSLRRIKLKPRTKMSNLMRMIWK